MNLERSVVRQDVQVKQGWYLMLSVHDSRTVTDSGKGPGIFEPFFDSLEDPPGLSLAAVYGAVKQSSGYIWVFSSPGKGTAFNIYFPRIEAP